MLKSLQTPTAMSMRFKRHGAISKSTRHKQFTAAEALKGPCVPQVLEGQIVCRGLLIGIDVEQLPVWQKLPSLSHAVRMMRAGLTIWKLVLLTDARWISFAFLPLQNE